MRLFEYRTYRVPALAGFFHTLNKQRGVQKITFEEFQVSRAPRFGV